MNKEQNAYEMTDIVENIKMIKKAILGKAFRGELGTNDQKEENVIELIKNAIQEKINTTFVQPVKIKKKEYVRMKQTIIEVLERKKKMNPEELKREVDLDIDEFYNQLKDLIEAGKIFETRFGDEVFLEAK
jgi:type I restriction enzyme S subunit